MYRLDRCSYLSPHPFNIAPATYVNKLINYERFNYFDENFFFSISIQWSAIFYLTTDT